MAEVRFLLAEVLEVASVRLCIGVRLACIGDDSLHEVLSCFNRHPWACICHQSLYCFVELEVPISQQILSEASEEFIDIERLREGLSPFFVLVEQARQHASDILFRQVR